MDTVNEASNESSSSFLRKYQLIIFFVLVLAFSAGLNALVAQSGDENFAILVVFTPSLIAIVLTALVSGRVGLRELLVKQTIQPVRFRWVVIALFIIPLIAAVAIFIHSLFGGPTLSLRMTELLPFMVLYLLISIGEEYGWRGFALPRLEKRNTALVASLILGLVWGFWHFPGYLVGVGTPSGMPFYVFMLWVIPATILITWVYNNTKSVLMAILMHTAANATFNYLPLTPSGAGQITTFYLFLALLWLVTIVVIIVFGPGSLIRKPVSQLETE